MTSQYSGPLYIYIYHSFLKTLPIAHKKNSIKIKEEGEKRTEIPFLDTESQAKRLGTWEPLVPCTQFKKEALGV
jgi:hypothetical protein